MWTKTAVLLPARGDRPGGWHYAQLWDHGGGPIGFCADHDPHPTEFEARECYAAYLRTRVVYDAAFGGWSGCKVCDAPTKAGAGVHTTLWVEPFCDEHRTPEFVVPALGLDQPAGDSFGS